MKMLVPLMMAAVAGAALVAGTVDAAERAVHAPKPALVVPAKGRNETAVFAGGCFWGVEGVFEQVRGVKRAVSGYAGGRERAPTYQTVSSGATGAAEAVRVDFDPSVVSYAELLQIYFSVVADPTQRNRQGPDTGTQYRTALFPVTPAQARQAKAYIAQLGKSGTFERPIVTSVESGRFVAAESYHQDYMRQHPNELYIRVNDRPKVEALRRLFPKQVRG